MSISRRGGSLTRPICGCGNLGKTIGLDAKGRKKYANICGTCRRRGRRNKKPYCEMCGFVAIDLVQLDVDHKDGNPKNNNEDNLQTLCANCHRLKSKINNDWRKLSEKV